MLSNESVEALLRNYFGDRNFEVVTWSLVPYFDSINGFLGQHLRLKVSLKRNERPLLKLQFFAKSLPQKSSPFHNFIFQSNGYGKEIFFYTSFTELALKVDREFRVAPRMFFGADGTIVLEDMEQTGYRSAKFAEVDEAHVLVALKTVAKLHAVGFKLDNIRAKSLIDEFPSAFNEPLLLTDSDSLLYKLCVSASDAIKDLVRYLPESSGPIASDDEFRQKFAEEFRSMLETFTNGDKNYRRVCCHGDLWLNNLLFKYDGSKAIDCLMVDFQLLRYAPPAHDVTFMIYYNTKQKVRQESYEEFLRKYYEYLTEELSKHNMDIRDILPVEEYDSSCKLYMKFAKMIKGVYATLNDIPQNRVQELTTNSERFFNFLLVDRRQDCRQLIESEPSYRETILELIADIRHDVCSAN